LRVHANKRALRVLGVAESFARGDRFSTLAGVVMRADLVIDGFAFGRATVGGDDATEGILKLCRGLKRDDVNILMLSGAVISGYNMVDVDGLSTKTGLPVVCLTYRESPGIEDAIRRRFGGPGGDVEDAKLLQYRGLGERVPIAMKTGFTVYLRLASVSTEEARRVVDAFTLQGRIPEPVRVARLLSSARRADHVGAPRRISATSSR
jgi:uncharacterized protein